VPFFAGVAMSTPRKKSGLAFRAVGEEGGLIVVPGQSEVKVLNPVGAKIYGLLDGSHTEDAIVRAVMEEFEVTEEDARRDYRQFVGELDREGLLAADEGGNG